MSDPAETQEVAIIGGGIASLADMATLAERGVRPLVLKANPNYAGGRLAGGATNYVEHDGPKWPFRLEHGVHGMRSPFVNFKRLPGQFSSIKGALPTISERTVIFLPMPEQVQSSPIGE